MYSDKKNRKQQSTRKEYQHIGHPGATVQGLLKECRVLMSQGVGPLQYMIKDKAILLPKAFPIILDKPLQLFLQ